MALFSLQHHDRTQRFAAARRGRRGARRAVASVLAMMFLVLFGSLAAAMAVVAQGNLRTADSAIKVSRAMSAAETGLVFATRRLEQETARFVVEKGVIDADFAAELWLGTVDAGDVTVLPPTGYTPTTPPAGIAEAIVQAHEAESHALVVEPGDSSLPSADVGGTVLVAPIAIEEGSAAAYFRLRYELLEAEDPGDPMVRITSEGHDGDIVRILRLDFSITKKIEFALLSPNRIMIGKNVLVEGPLGSRYGVVSGELDTENGDPLVLRSDFYHLDSTLDAQLDMFYAEVVEHDVDGDARLRPDHPTEVAASVDGQALADLDADGNEYVDDFDLFLAHYDAAGNGDGVLVYDSALAGGLADEFDEPGDDPDQLGRLIDRATPDRNGDGIEGDATDVALGYNDGILDGFDQYAKVTGRIAFAVAQSAWETAHGDSYQTVVQGPVLPAIDEAPAAFEVSTDEMLDITTSMFDGSQSWFEGQVPDDGGTDFADQVAAAGGTYTPVDPDPDAGVHNWESVPFGSAGAYDYYDRPTYEDMTFTNVRIPQGTNGLFKNCVFVGVTYVESDADCDHPNWNYAGSLTQVEESPGVYAYELKFPDLNVDQGGTIIADTRGNSNNIRFEDCVFLGSVAGDRLDSYTHWRNKIQMTGNTRFYLESSEVPATEADQATLQGLLDGIAEADRTELRKSSLLMPGWSVDVGNFTNEPSQKVNLKGTIISGILDVRGSAEVHGTLLMSHRAVEGEGPLYYGGQTDAFNTTIGYFGPTDGDSEGMDPDDPDFNGFGEIRLRYDPDALLPDGIPWPVRAEMVPQTYVEGGV